MLEVKGLNKKSQKKEILKEITFTVQRGEIAVFLGQSGVGKSTLLRVCNNLASYDSGAFLLDGKALDLCTVSKNHTVGMVFQDFNLFDHLSVEENIQLPLIKCQSKKRVEAEVLSKALLERYGLLDKAKSSTRTLSGGQKQRLAIARTVALNPQVICLDEPTSALDPTHTSQIASYILQIKEENRIVLLTTHDTELLTKLDARLFLMKEGMIVESATTKEYYANSKQSPELCSFLHG